jgi:hypothetical protein
MSGKSAIKDEVWHQQFADCVLAADKSDLDGRTNGIPRLSGSAANSGALQTITAAIDDTGVRMHGLTYLPGMFGDSLVETILASVERFFREYPHGETFVMRMDLGPFMPEPKRATQIDHTRGIVTQMERKNIEPIAWNVGEPVPLMIAYGVPLPEWTAVRADRTLFRHACNQLMELIAKTYRPPRGCRLILDYNVPCMSSGIGSLQQWMADERVHCSPLARRTIAAARRRFALRDDWHTEADRLVVALARAGHIKVAPVCIETSLDTSTTYAPFVLHGAAHNCGEADVGCLFWIDALQSDKLHRTLEGVRCAPPGDDGLVSAPAAPVPSVEQRRQAGLRILDESPDAVMLANDASSYMARYLTYAVEPDAAGTPAARRASCGAALVISVDTDFLSLVVLWYAQFCHEQGAERRDYCRAHAPFLSMGELKSKRRGWLTCADDIVSTEALKALPAAESGGVMRCFAIWDIERLHARVTALTAHGTELERVASFAMFNAACKNDYLPGFFGVNRRFAYEALLATGVRLVRYDARNKPIVDLGNVVEFVKHTYYLSLTAKGGPHAPKQRVAQMSYAQVAECVAKKYKNKLQAHMPSRVALELLYKRYQWWISMATEAWRDLGGILNHRKWGWSELH